MFERERGGVGVKNAERERERERKRERERRKSHNLFTVLGDPPFKIIKRCSKSLKGVQNH